MVDALRDIWRVVREHGLLVDVRPLSSRCPLEAVCGERVVHLGDVDGTGMLSDDRAADAAMRTSVGHGWFVPRRSITFDFRTYWDSVAEMASMLDARRRKKQVVPSYADLERTHHDLRARHGGVVRLRCRTPTLLAVYERAISPATQHTGRFV